MKPTIYAFIFCFATGNALAQKISLNEAVQKGLANRLELKAQNLNIQVAGTENEKIKARWLPQISGNADIRWNTQLQTTILPFALPGSAETQTEVRLGRPFNNSFLVQAEQKVYDANRKIDLQLNNTQLDAQKNNLEQLRVNLKQAITEAYYNCVFAKERLNLSVLALERAKSYLEVGKARFDQGAILKNDLDKLELDASNAQLAQTKNQQDYDLSLIALQYQLNTSETVEPGEDLQAIFGYSQVVQGQLNIENRAEIKAEQLSRHLNELNAQKQLARNRPMVSVYGNYSYFQLSETLNPFEKNTWFPANYIGIRANVPIFDGRQARLTANDFRVRQQINVLNAERLRNDFSYESKSTWNTLQQSKLNLEEARKNIDLAHRILETDKFRFEKGVILLSDLKNTEYALQNAETQYLSSIYNFLIASVRYKKASGNL
ncbi:TolC family protein [Emticicia sp. 21SJ11W-3]|uniref:TolC family protein n=1 Tax=Emticicia sp. 21SJ11W-3 TaxID=2916755 RepID=UPI0020A1424B|nr:TolC family protein [Emticicia sp. 21SJ11W-3]UTA69192.1 TolC family protein [Emticicia sp. 21SJ11W-3]